MLRRLRGPLAAAAVLGLAVPNSTAMGQTGEGVSNGGGFEWLHASTRNRSYNVMRQAGADWHRIEIKWSAVDRCNGTYDWSVYDDDIRAAARRGIKTLATLAYSPRCRRPAGWSDKWGPNSVRRRAAFAAFARATARRYRGRVSAYELWNEPNVEMFWRPAPNLPDYVALVKTAYARIKAVDPNALVLAGATAPAQNSSHRIDEVTFIRRAYGRGVGGSFDAWSHHPYTVPFRPSGTHAQNSWFQMCCGAPSIRSTMDANGDAGKSIWGTEFGAPTNRVSEAEQAAQIRDAYRVWGSYPWAGVLFAYTLRDNTGFAGDTYGLLRADWRKKPAFSAYRDVAAGSRLAFAGFAGVGPPAP
jgi:polysaccharide biosynthesis protein PslG